MTSFKRILFPVEFSPQCQLAAPHVAAWARRFGAQVTILHVQYMPVMPMEGVVWDVLPEPAMDRLTDFLVEEFRDIDVQRIVRRGEPAAEIVRYLRNESADLVMMPTHGTGVFRRFLVGSVTARVLHDAPCPVWTTAHLQEQIPVIRPDLENVLCAVDLDERGLHTLRYAGAFASRVGARLTISHAVPMTETIPRAYTDLRADLVGVAREKLAEMQTMAEARGVLCVGTGNVAAFVSHAARDHKADLVIIGRGGHGLLGRLRTHDYGIIRDCPSPVLSL